jgi:hypothetical protein
VYVIHEADGAPIRLYINPLDMLEDGVGIRAAALALMLQGPGLTPYEGGALFIEAPTRSNAEQSRLGKQR